MLVEPDNSDDQPDAVGRQWLDRQLLLNGRRHLGNAEAMELVEAEDTSLQIAILKACVARLPALRERWSESDVYELGEQLYFIAGKLYDAKLPFAEQDLCDILRLSKHGCGHGTDVSSPIELAAAHMANHEFSPDLLCAVSAYIDGLKGIGSIQAKTAKRRAAILFLLDRSDVLGMQGKTKKVWSQRFTSDLATKALGERREWERFVLTLKLQERSDLPNTWRKVAESFLSRLGEGKVVSQVADWWPEENTVCKLDTGGSHLLKHFVWLLEVVDADSPLKSTCDGLVCRLAAVEWKPKQPAAKAIATAAQYLTRLPKEVAWGPLQAMSSAASSKQEKVRRLVEEYASVHKIEIESAEAGSGDRDAAAKCNGGSDNENPWWKVW